MVSLKVLVPALLALVLTASSASAQPAGCDLVLSGAVIDDHDRTPLSYAEVFLPELMRGAISDEQGRYRIEGLCAGTYVLKVAHLGCEPVVRKIDLQRDLIVDFRLEHHAEELREMEIIRDRPDENVGFSTGELRKADLEKRSGTGLAEMIEGIPGVTILRTGPTIAKPIIHGLSGNRILTLNQGVRQEDQQWGTDHAPNLDPFSTDGITVVKGAAAVQYGADAMGGVVITEPVRLPRESGIAGEVRAIGLWNGRGGGPAGMLHGAVHKVKGLGWRVQGSSRQLGDSEAPDYVLSNTGMRESAASGSVGITRHWGSASVYYSWFGREMGVLRAAHIGNLTDLDNAIASGRPWFTAPFGYAIDPPRQAMQHHLLKTELAYRLSERDQLVITYAYQNDDRQEYDLRRGGRSNIPSLDLFLDTHTGDAVVKHWIGPKLHGKVGLNGMLQENTNMPGTGIKPLIPDYTKRTAGLFILEHYPLNDELELEFGGRLEGTELAIRRFNSANEYTTPQHRFVNSAISFGANWSITDSIQVRTNISSAFRPPHVSELYSQGLHHGSAAIEEGDEQLGSERSLKATIDLQGSWFKGKLTTDITLFADRISDFIYLSPAGYRLTIRGAFPVFSYVATDVFMHGMDASLRYRIAGPWSLRSQLSVVRARNIVADEWLFLTPSDRLRNSLVWNARSAGKWKDPELSVSSSVVFEQTRFPVGLDFIDPPPAYHLLAFSISVERPMGRNALRMGLNGENLLNANYRDYLDRFRYFADARGMDLSLWLRYSFGQVR